jgi:hypothetical protein
LDHQLITILTFPAQARIEPISLKQPQNRIDSLTAFTFKILPDHPSSRECITQREHAPLHIPARSEPAQCPRICEGTHAVSLRVSARTFRERQLNAFSSALYYYFNHYYFNHQFAVIFAMPTNIIRLIINRLALCL